MQHVLRVLLADGVSSGNPLVDWLANNGAVGVLALVVVAFFRGWIVPGTELKLAREERDRAMTLLLESTKVSSKSLDIAEKQVR